MSNFVSNIKFNSEGLVPVVAQAADSKEVLMMAWMNKEAVEKTLQTGEVYYWSRSRNSLWRKGEASGHTQKLKKILVDCDNDTLLVLVEQRGVACHTGRRSCFFSEFRDGNLIEVIKQEMNPKEIYAKKD